MAGRLNVVMVGHSYCVALNRRLCREVARVGGDQVAVTVAAPAYYQGDLRPIPLEPLAGEPYDLRPIPTHFSRVPHIFLYGRALRKLLRGASWDVVHAWEEPYICAGGQIAAATPRSATLIYSSFQNQPKRFPPPFRQIERYCLARATGWTAFGATVADNLRDRPGYRDRPWTMIPLGVDAHDFHPDLAARQELLRRLGWDDGGPPVVGYLGRFVPEKGLGMLMRSLDRLEPASWRALFIGGGPMEAELRAWADQRPEQARILTGVRHAEVPAHLNTFDILAAPSQTTPRWKEQLGRMLLEGMATGLALLASDSGEMPHVVADAGLIVPEADESAWVESLRAMLASPDRRRELGARGLERARSVYGWDRIAGQFLDFFRQCREAKHQ